MVDTKFLSKQSVAWALYDCGNSAFALTVLAVLFPLFLGSYWSAGDPGAVVTTRLSFATALASLIVSLIAPVVGAIADSGGYRKRFLFLLALLGAAGTTALSLIGMGGWAWALAIYIVASTGFYSANVFYDSLLVDVTKPRYYDLVSSLGLSLGYIGSAILLTVQVWMLSSPETFGFSDISVVIKFAFASVGVWWFIFMLPLMIIVKEKKQGVSRSGNTIRAAYQSLRETFTRIRNYRNVFLFLVAYWFYIGGVFTVIFMAVNFGQRLGFETQDLVTALLITNFVGFPATLAFGYLGHHFGAKRAIYGGIVVYALVACWAWFLEDVQQFYAMSITIGMVQGGVQAMSRSFFAGLIPADQSGEFFGFYNMVSKFAHVLGPVLVGVTTIFSDDPKYIISAVLPMFILGALFLGKVDGQAQQHG